MCGKQQETVSENTGKNENEGNAQNTNKTHTETKLKDNTQGVPRQIEAVV